MSVCNKHETANQGMEKERRWLLYPSHSFTKNKPELTTVVQLLVFHSEDVPHTTSHNFDGPKSKI